MADAPDPEASDFRVRPTPEAQYESRVQRGVFDNVEERAWVLTQLRLLRHWPLSPAKQGRLGADLDFSKVHHAGDTFYELRLTGAPLSHNKNLRIFFWADGNSKTIWILHAYWKKTQRLDESVKARVARRLRHLKGQIQDGSEI